MRRLEICCLLAAITMTPGAARAQSAPELDPLPEPALTEPFAIGEALFDAARVDVGVVSLLERMGLSLPESYVRSLIDMGRADLAASNDESLPWSFRDLHTAIEPLLPDVTVEELARAYSTAYAAAPDAPAPLALLGMPIEPDTPLTRPQLWLLLVDGFASAPNADWRIANAAIQDLPSPLPGLSQADFLALIPLLPMLAYQVPFEVAPLPASGHEGHGGPGAPFALQARIGLSPQPWTNPQSGQTVLPPSARPAGNVNVWWTVRNRPRIEQHGRFDVPTGVPVRTDPLGVARLTFSPRQEEPSDRAFELSASSTAEARVAQWDLLTARYEMPPALRGFVWGDRVASGVIEVGWHGDEVVRIRLENEYVAALNFSFLGNGTRAGTDVAEGTLERQPDGSWEGEVAASVTMSQELQGLGQRCPRTEFRGAQRLRVTAEPVSGYAITQTIAYTTGVANGGYLALVFEPTEPPRISPRGPCLDLFQRDLRDYPFLPLNDGRWTEALARYVIGLPESGVLEYEDTTVNTFPSAAAAPASAHSTWRIRIERP